MFIVNIFKNILKFQKYDITMNVLMAFVFEDVPEDTDTEDKKADYENIEVFEPEE